MTLARVKAAREALQLFLIKPVKLQPNIEIKDEGECEIGVFEGVDCLRADHCEKTVKVISSKRVYNLMQEKYWDVRNGENIAREYAGVYARGLLKIAQDFSRRGYVVNMGLERIS